jgi:sugar/nucleoside kinase (ribokinase family)
VRRLLPLVDLVHGNVAELNRFADSDDLGLTLRCLVDWGAAAVVIHRGAEGAGYYSDGRLVVEPCAPIREHKNTAGSGDLLSVCMILLHRRTDIPIPDKLRLANRVVAEFIEGKRQILPPL